MLRSQSKIPVHANCAICNCPLHSDGKYADGSHQSRSRQSKHHVVAERFFGRSANRPNDVRQGILVECPWNSNKATVPLCYECHEELIHNPVFLQEDLKAFSDLVRAHGLDEDVKPIGRDKIAGRIKLLNDVIKAGLKSLST